MSESVAVAVMIKYSSYIKGKIFEIDVVELLKSVKSIRIESASWPPLYDGERSSVRYTLITEGTSPRRNDGGVDIICEAGFNVNLHLIQKIILIESNIGPSVVRELRGAICQRDLGTIGILVSPRLNFTEFAVNEAKISTYPVILTDKSHLPEIILNLAIDSLQDIPYDFLFYHELVNH
ncbi:15507_t:CDS:2 [Cetraspora pellucida]|uniref:15507_t:CDS:1 n=1 Tax=Cetraspora pellucida TaxID=1433469 RepID=A0A9N9C376_9GLOM|nr:15507_t:CDS:2 [Cetraspora pellucida]